ncbi:MAG: M48 family metallopeptidase [Euryarchaeota archaeon]|nr:M48 family metallopeptidase [Euryarchaeota archaeon]
MSLVDYVVVHELVHLTHPNHSREFWGTVASVLPDYDERRERLRIKGNTLVF